ncbi:hypothetical protein M1N18_00430 [Dehalococcoidales bacterium]|nr:hypothetical protein [Dehalococcoidales bacterium]MCL0094644.1 hypothetical protein [Dehalococcoidales bacterium]
MRHPESNGRIERYHRSVREEAFGDTEVDNFYRARDIWGETDVVTALCQYCVEIATR